MKAAPLKFEYGVGYHPCEAHEADHVRLNLPGPTGCLILPVGRTDGRISWNWNGDTEKPTLTPSIRTTGHDYVCHSYITDGVVDFLADSSHEYAGRQETLNEV